MEIKTRFNVGDEVWYKWRNEAIEDYVEAIDIHIRIKRVTITYTLHYAGIVCESDLNLFATKEELLKNV